MKKFLLNLYIWPASALITVLGIVLVIPPALLYSAISRKNTLHQVTRKGIRLYGKVLVQIMPFMAPVTVEDRSGGFTTPVIFTANHNSSIDPYIFGLLPYEMAFVTTWPFKIPFYNLMMHLARYINATKGWDHVETEGKKLLNDHCSLILWPEGHRSRDGDLKRFRNGAFHLALSSGRPIVPVCIKGSFKFLPPGNRLLSPARIKMVLLPPILPCGNADDPEHVKRLKDQVKNSIAEEYYHPNPVPDPQLVSMKAHDSGSPATRPAHVNG
ncbi:lysophospholipid acyltransferase family protein [Thermodesulfobacteriota bacterium]